MLTRKRWQPPTGLTGEAAKLALAIQNYLLSLDHPDALEILEYSDISGLTVTASSGTITSASAVGKYARFRDAIWYLITATITTNGTGAGVIVINGLPELPNDFYPASATLTGNIACVATAFNNGGASQINIAQYDGTYPGADGNVIRISGFYFL